MRRNVKRIVYVMFTILAFLVTTKSMAEAYESQYVEVVNEGAPIRTEPYKEADVIITCSEGRLLECEGGICNSHGNGWYIVNVQGNSGYIYMKKMLLLMNVITMMFIIMEQHMNTVDVEKLMCYILKRYL